MRRRVLFGIIAVLAICCAVLCALWVWLGGRAPFSFRAHKAYRDVGFREEKVSPPALSKADKVLSLFLDGGEPYMLVKDEENEGLPYRILHIAPGGGARDVQAAEEPETDDESRFTMALNKWQKEQEDLKTFEYETIRTRDDYLYLVGRKNAVYVNKLIRLQPDRAAYEEFPISSNMEYAAIVGIEMSPRGTAYIVAKERGCTTRYRMSLQETADASGNILTVDNYMSNIGSTYVPGVSVSYYWWDDDPMVVQENFFGESTPIVSKYITDVDAPACLDERDGIYMVEADGILYHAKNGSVWEIVLPAQDMQAFDREICKPLQLMRASEEAYYLLTEDKKTGGRTVYAYFDD